MSRRDAAIRRLRADLVRAKGTRRICDDPDWHNKEKPHGGFCPTCHGLDRYPNQIGQKATDYIWVAVQDVENALKEPR